MVILQSWSDSLHVNDPSSPRKLSYRTRPVLFHSVPATPTGELSGNVPFPWDAEAKLGTSVGIVHDLDDFEFKIPMHQYKWRQKENRRCAVEDALCDTHEVPQLKLPPCLQQNNKPKSISGRLATSSSMSRNSVLRRSFSFLSCRNKDFDVDPFTAALDNVRVEDMEREQGMAHQRSQSLSPVNTNPQWPSYRNATRSQNKEAYRRQSTSEVGSTSTMPLNSTQQRSKRKRDYLLRSASEGRTDLKYKLRTCTAVFRKLHELWKSRFEVFLKRKL